MFLWFKNKYWFTIFTNFVLNYCHALNSYYWKTPYNFITGITNLQEYIFKNRKQVLNHEDLKDS